MSQQQPTNVPSPDESRQRAPGETEAALRAAETKYRALVEQLPVIIYTVELGEPNRTVYISPQVETILGFSPQEWLADPELWIRQLHPDDRARVLVEVRQRDARQKPLDVEYRALTRDGRIVWLHNRNAFTPGEPGQPGHLHGIIHDISTRKFYEDAWRYSEERFAKIFQFSPIAVSISTLADGRFVDVNENFLQLSGYSLEEVIGYTSRELNLWTSFRDRPEIIQALMEKGFLRDLKLTLRNKAGQARQLTAYLGLINLDGVACILAMGDDITERNRAEEAMREHAFYLARLNDITRAAASTLDFETLMQTLADRLGELIHADGCYLTLWDEGRQMAVPTAAYGDLRETYPSLAPLPGETTMTASVIHAGHALVAENVFNTPYLSPRIAGLFPARSLLGLPLIVGEQKLGAVMLGFNQTHHFTLDEIARCEQAAGQIALTIAKARLLEAAQQELRERRQAEAKLERTLSVLQATFESTGDGILVVGGGQIVNFNQQFAAMWGFPPYLLEARKAEQMLAYVQRQLRNPEEFLARVNALRSGPASIFHDTLELKDGRVVEVYSQPQIIGDKNGGRVLSFRDITERKQREREQEAILAVATALRVAQSRAEMSPIILDQLLKLLDVDSAALGMIDSHTGEVVIELGRGEWTAAGGVRLGPGQGIGGLVVATGQPYLTNYVREEAPIVYTEHFKTTSAAACVPLIALGQTIGVLLIGRGRAGGPAIFPGLTQNDLRLLIAIGEITASAIHRAALHEQTLQRLEQLNALRAIDIAINTSADLKMTLDTVLNQVKSQLKVDAAGVLLLDAHSQQLTYVAGQGFFSPIIARLPVRLGEGVAGQAALDRQTIHIANLAEAKNFSRTGLLAAEKFVSYSVVPLIAKGQVKGVLEVFHRAAFNPDAGWLEFLEMLAGQAAIAIDNYTLLADLQASNTKLALAYDITIEGWSRALDLRDKETEGHSQRVTEMTLRLARKIGMFGETELAYIRWGALLHDIGKMGVPDYILLKPGPLNEEEWAIMRKHPEYARDLIAPIDFLRPALDIPLYHHEKWDGTGYPHHLKSEQIPLAARIFAVVDVWDALRADRPYRSGWAIEKVLAHIREQSGKHFDPQVVEEFIRSVASK